MSDLAYKRWMVGLDLTEMDEQVVSWVNYLCSVFNPSVVYFVHVERNLEKPSYLPEELRDSFEVIDEGQRAAIEKTLSEHFEEDQVEIHIEVIEGKPIDSLLRWVEVKKIDFFIAGRKSELRSNGILPYKLARKLPCPILFVPEITVKEVKNILVPIDFSEHSKIATETAIHVASHFQESNVTCMHVYNVPVGYYKSGKSYDEFAGVMKENAEKEFERFAGSFNYKLQYKSFLMEGGSPPDLINEELNAGKYDLVIMGSKGQSFGAVMLLGSTAEKLIQLESKSLTWIVKKKDENIGFFKALSQL